MHHRTRLFLSGVFVMLGFTVLTANVKAQTVLDRDTGAMNSDRPYLQLAGLEGPSLHLLRHVSRPCQAGCPVQANGADADEQRAAARGGKAGSDTAPAPGAVGKFQVSCASPK